MWNRNSGMLTGVNTGVPNQGSNVLLKAGQEGAGDTFTLKIYSICRAYYRAGSWIILLPAIYLKMSVDEAKSFDAS